ncbi:helix-turn-helix domain-containing protein [Dyadobacter subterraneus]|uniref:AraC family transcriptional regulator n=1 Tax=Dyadobacter subterraneus TaxID=2773304 RepID=A0ABR9WGT5_9BACT|nr:helix-turn-helix domain-containing protein [Dyadobacter subterraneus]MBE9463369.1 AraC family transcriptional regulator [Dyadobacter subterraneus]
MKKPEPYGIHIDVEAPLNEVVKHIYCIRTPVDFQTTSQHLSPNLEMMLVFNFGKALNFSFADDPFTGLQMDKVAVIGPLRKMLKYELLPETNLIVVVFNPQGFYRLMQLPMDEIGENDLIDPDELLQIEGFHALWELLANLPLLEEKIKLLKEYGRNFFQDPDPASSPLLKGMDYFQNTSIQPVRAIAMDSDLSERTIQLRFKKYLGYSPKELLRFLRFKKVINSILNLENQEVDWYGLIEEFGYHDQSHLIKDFHHYLGTTPHKFVREIVGKEFCVSREGKFYL